MTAPAARLPSRLLAVVVLLLGLVALSTRWAPPTTWAQPYAVGPLAGDVVVRELRRTDTEVRLALEGPALRRAVRVVALDGHGEEELFRTARVRALLAPGEGDVPAEAVAALEEATRAWASGWPPPPAFVRGLGARMLPRQVAEAIVLEVLVLAWLAGLLWTMPGWWPRTRTVSRRALAGASLAAGGGLSVAAALGVDGVWHANFHGYDRIADVALHTPPSAAALGLLHGFGFYTVYQPLHALLGGVTDVFGLARLLSVGVLVGLFLWLRELWEDDAAAAWGVAAAASWPVWVRLAGSETMYLPAVLWLVWALWAFELHLRTDEGRWLLLGLPPAFLAMQTRAELMALVPLWLALDMLARKPAWLRTGWRRPVVWLGLGGSAALFVPRLLSLAATPPPSTLQRASVDPVDDPRLLLLAAAAVVGLLAVPWVRARLTGPWARHRPLLLGVASVLGSAFAAWVAVRWADTGGPRNRTWGVHAWFHPWLTAPWVALLPLVGGGWAWRRAPGRLGFLVLSWTAGLAVVLAQFDCHSTFVRTGVAALPFAAALSGAGLAWMARSLPVGPSLPGLLVIGGLVWGAPWLTTRFPKQQQGDLIEAAAALVPDDATVVWLSEEDVPGGAEPFRTTRARLDHHLAPHGIRTATLSAWRRGEVDGPVVFAMTTDCHRVLLDPDGDTALAGTRRVPWERLDRSDITVGEKIRVDVPPGWLQPDCRAAARLAREPLWTVPLSRWNAGSVYEQNLGEEPVLGLYPLRASP